MAELMARERQAAYDAVGRYDQDRVNGFDETFLDDFASLVDPVGTSTILEAMAGDGKFLKRLHALGRKGGGTRSAKLAGLEYSRVQCEFAKRELDGLPVEMIWGDVVEMRDLARDKPLPDCSYEKVVVKSGNHEIPGPRQPRMYESIHRVLQPGGQFINLGFVFENADERDEMRGIARTKDALAGMAEAVVNRHFLTREELHAHLKQAGFVDVRCHREFDYAIDSQAVVDAYFTRCEAGAQRADLEHQAAQARAFAMRRSGRIRFEGLRSLMLVPGEVTVARRPTWVESNLQAFRHCPYEFLRYLAVYREMLERVLRHVPMGAAVLDVACGPGLLAERLVDKKVSRYRGLDLSPHYVDSCRERLATQPAFSFALADMNQAEFGEEEHDAVTILNALYLAGVEPVKVLRKAHRALKPGGTLLVTGPTAFDSFTKAEPRMVAQLKADGLLEKYGEQFRKVAEANARLLPAQGNYWSAEGMTALLREIGFSQVAEVDTTLYYGCSFLVAARK